MSFLATLAWVAVAFALPFGLYALIGSYERARDAVMGDSDGS